MNRKERSGGKYGKTINCIRWRSRQRGGKLQDMIKKVLYLGLVSSLCGCKSLQLPPAFDGKWEVLHVYSDGNDLMKNEGSPTNPFDVPVYNRALFYIDMPEDSLGFKLHRHAPTLTGGFKTVRTSRGGYEITLTMKDEKKLSGRYKMTIDSITQKADDLQILTTRMTLQSKRNTIYVQRNEEVGNKRKLIFM